jgi:hypothetical protein
MGPVVVVVVDVTADDPPQPGLCENDEAVQAFPPERNSFAKQKYLVE